MASKVVDGTIAVPEGTLYDKYEIPLSASTDSSKPILLFLHAAVSDHTVWDGQIPFFVSRGYPCLRVDRFGFGHSHASEAFLALKPRPAVDHVQHIRLLLSHVLGSAAGSESTRVIAIGLSMGGGLAFDLATSDSLPMISGLVVVAGGLLNNGKPNQPAEDALFEEADHLLAAGPGEGRAEELAQLQVRIWGDGPLQPKGRMGDATMRGRMLDWNREIAARELAGMGGAALEMVDVQNGPPQVAKIEVPTLIAYGIYDETNTTTGMQMLLEGIKGAEGASFEAAHMIPLEKVEEFNNTLGDWIERKFA